MATGGPADPTAPNNGAAGDGAGALSPALTYASSLVEGLTEDARTTSRNAQQALMIADRCEEILAAVNVSLEQEADDFLESLNQLTFISTFEQSLLQITLVLGEETGYTEPTPEAVSTWARNYKLIGDLLRELHREPFLTKVPPQEEGWEQKLISAPKYDELTWVEFLCKSLEKDVENAKEEDKAGMKAAMDVAQNLRSMSSTMWDAEPSIKEAATASIMSLNLAVSASKSEDPEAPPVEWNNLTQVLSNMTTAAKTNDVTIVAAVNEELNTIQSALPETVKPPPPPVIRAPPPPPPSAANINRPDTPPTPEGPTSGDGDDSSDSDTSDDPGPPPAGGAIAAAEPTPSPEPEDEPPQAPPQVVEGPREPEETLPRVLTPPPAPEPKSEPHIELIPPPETLLAPPGPTPGPSSPSPFSPNTSIRDEDFPIAQAFGAHVEEQESTSDVPGPSSAPPHPPPAKATGAAPDSTARNGQIRVFVQKGDAPEEFLGYVARQIHGGKGVLVNSRRVTSVGKDALQVSFDTRSVPCGFSIGKDQWVGITWSPATPALTGGSTDYAAVTTVRGETNSKTTMNKTWQGPTRAGAWRVDGTTGTVFPLWDGIELIPVVNLSKKFEQPLEVVVDMEAFTRKYPGWAVVRLAFEDS